MTITALATPSNDYGRDIPHPVWCHQVLCGYSAGQSAIHQHPLGRVAHLEVVIERTDEFDEAGRLTIGAPRVVVEPYRSSAEQGPGLTVDEVDELTFLLNLARVFVVEVG